MKLENVDWDGYYDKIEGRPPRPLLRSALTFFHAESPNRRRRSIDLGCGDGTDSLFLLENGWQVLAIDGESKAIDRLLAKTPGDLQGSLQTRVAHFEDVILPPADLLLASLTLPFCDPVHFDELWQKIIESLGENGRFAGHFFGVNDDWAGSPGMTFHTQAEVMALLAPFKIEHLDETDEVGRSASGPKHWHIFTVIAQRSNS